MKRALVLMGVLALSAGLVGCSTDPREGLVAATVGDLETAATKVANIKTRLDDAVKKTEVGKNPDFKEAILEIDGLKKIAAEMKNKKNQADALKDTTTEEEKKELTDRVKGRLVDVVDRLSKAKKELNDTMAQLEVQHKDALKTVREKLIEADGEFEAISRQR